MSKIWNGLQELRESYIEMFDNTSCQTLAPKDFNDGSLWMNRKWKSETLYKEAHVSVVDARDTRGLFMMHVCIFPHLSNDSPIFGFDVIGGKNKITGVFCDYSPTVNYKHPLSEYFEEKVSKTQFNKTRNIPDWGKQIFSESIIAAGNVREEELDTILELVLDLSSNYIENLEKYNNNSEDDLVRSAHKNYCHWQRQNPHTPRTMKALGVPDEKVEKFISECLFPE